LENSTEVLMTHPALHRFSSNQTLSRMRMSLLLASSEMTSMAKCRGGARGGAKGAGAPNVFPKAPNLSGLRFLNSAVKIYFF